MKKCKVCGALGAHYGYCDKCRYPKKQCEVCGDEIRRSTVKQQRQARTCGAASCLAKSRRTVSAALVKICKTCGVSFTSYKRLKRTSCGREDCKKPCDNCGELFKPIAWQANNQRFCSSSCSDFWHHHKARRYEYTCQHCKRQYKAKAKDRDKYCSRECAWAAGVGYLGLKTPVTNTCKRCNKVVGSVDCISGFCPSCYRAERLKPCENSVCENVFFAPHLGAKYCSARCGDFMREARRNPEMLEIRHCKTCGADIYPYVGRKNRWFCSKTCVKKGSAHKASRSRARARRRARKKGAKTERFNHVEIFDRDKWTCQICGATVRRDLEFPHDRYATIDHVVPLSKGGNHTRENVQTACFICNSTKSDKVNYAAT